MNRPLSLFLLLSVATVARGQALSLHEAVERALAHSPELRALEAGVAEAQANAILGDAFRTSASVATTPGYATGLPVAVLGQVPAIATVEAHRLLFDRSARAEQLAASLPVEAAKARLETRKRELALAVAELWARVGADAELLGAAGRRVAACETLAAHASDLQREGRARELDSGRAGLQLATAQRAAAHAESQLALDRLRLSRLLGESVENVTASVKTPATGIAAAVATMPGEIAPGAVPTAQPEWNDPELHSLSLRLAGAQQALALNARLFQPSIAAQIQYSRLFDRFRRYYLSFTPDDFSVGATVTVPLWTGGRRTASSERLAAQVQELTAQRDTRRSELELAVREAESELAEALAEVNLASRGLAVAAEGLRVAEELAKEGRGEANDVPLARIAVADAEDVLASTRLRAALARARLRFARGEMPDG